MSLKKPVTSPGIDAGTVRLVAQSLNHYATSGPQLFIIVINNSNMFRLYKEAIIRSYVSGR